MRSDFRALESHDCLLLQSCIFSSTYMYTILVTSVTLTSSCPHPPLVFCSSMEEKVRKVPRRLVGCLGRRDFPPSGVAGGVGTKRGEERRQRWKSWHQKMGGVTTVLYNSMESASSFLNGLEPKLVLV